MYWELTNFEKVLDRARSGDEEAIGTLRAFVSGSGRNAPPDDLVKIADFILDFLRQHVQKHVSHN